MLFSKLNLILLFLFCLSWAVQAQQIQKLSTYGGSFTPQGDLKALVVFVIFEDNNPANPKFNNKEAKFWGWDAYQNNGLPKVVNTKTGSSVDYIFNSPEDFSQENLDKINYNYSKEFYLMSNGKFKFMGEVFKDSTGEANVVKVNPNEVASWSGMNRKVIEKMRKMNPNMDLSSFDQRKNNPQFLFNNADTSIHKADGIVDYIIFLYRYKKNWSLQPVPGMQHWVGSGGGFSSIGIASLEKYNGYQFAQGFTMMYQSGVFIHEIAHTLHNAPHMMGVNHTTGDYFERPSAGWGSTVGLKMFQGFNAWERWYLGYIDPKMINNEGDIRVTNEFILRDFITSGDAIRIKLPFVSKQYLWLENHTGEHFFDQHQWKGSVIDKDTIANTAQGVYAYVERIAAKRTDIIRPLTNITNGLKPLNASGNYDYQISDDPPSSNGWGNKIYKFKRLKKNPLSGTNRWYFFMHDFDKDGKIKMNRNYNHASQESEAIQLEEVMPDQFSHLYGGFGVYDPQKSTGYTRSPAFGHGDVLSMTSNPALTNHQRYLHRQQKEEPIVLNGLEIQFEKIQNSTAIKVKVAYRKTRIQKNLRWTGNIELPNISQDDQADLVLSCRRKLRLDKSGTNDRHTQNSQGEFINPTLFVVKSDAKIHLEEKSVWIIDTDASLVLEEGAKLVMDKKSLIRIKKGGRLVLNGNELKKHAKAKIVNEGGELIP
ncbi:MAG: hypothetical protein MK212_07945 [Saprospiraceae bacterium]|nr:hypothetical protein [Saprospiraceae bacterium]